MATSKRPNEKPKAALRLISVGRELHATTDDVYGNEAIADSTTFPDTVFMFSLREKEIFDVTSLTWVHKLDSEYFFRFPVEGGTLKLGLKIYELDIGGFTFVQSHFVKEPYRISDRAVEYDVSSSAESALELAVDAITTFYDAAIKAGDHPQSWWFVANEEF